MSPSSRTIVIVGIAALAVVFVARLDGSVTSIAGKDKVKKEVRFVVTANISPSDIFTVPADRELVITDLVIRNVAPTAIDVFFQESGSHEDVYFAHVNADGQFTNTFVTGPKVSAGEALQVKGLTEFNIIVYVAGYLRTP